jgi:hypothetical protein
LYVKESQTRQDHTSIYHGVLYGAFLKMFIVTKGEPRLAFFIPGTPEYEALKRGKIVFAFTKMGRAEQVFEFDYCPASAPMRQFRRVE